ncbi:MAG: DUF1540 domain-containing protein [Armatimonadota bacterium]
MVPEVNKCSVNQCFYNLNNECCAHSILVGSDEPICETYVPSQQQINRHGQAEVGACHIGKCAHNNDMNCHACSDIEVVLSNNQAWCNTFEPR